jgi:hypothetical protein
MGRESACRYVPPGSIFLQAAEGQGVFVCPDWYSGFLFSWEMTKPEDTVASFARICAVMVASGNFFRRR